MEFLEFFLVKMGKCSQDDISVLMDTFKRLDRDGSGQVFTAGSLLHSYS